MAGIVPALKPNDDVRIPGQQINDLAFPLISPLGTHNHDIGHHEPLSWPCRSTSDLRAMVIRF
jgi:hypothetical protein